VISRGLSPPTFRERNNTSGHHGNNDDGGKRLYRDEGFVPIVPKLSHAPAPLVAVNEKVLLWCREEVFAPKNAMLRFVARVLIARQFPLTKIPQNEHYSKPGLTGI
jgi:hypothetical protein